MKTKTLRLLCAIVVSLLAACGDDDGGNGGGGGSADASVGADAGFACDPMGANPATGALFNAPLEDDVEVIVKTPQHPGDPGPENLP